MRKILSLLLSSLLLFACCKSDDNMPAPIDQLPPATQTGEVIFACLVDGEPYICKGYDMVTAYYQWVDGGRVFSISGNVEDKFVESISLGNKDNAPIEEGHTYLLNDTRPGYGGGFLVKELPLDFEWVLTNSTYSGEMTITRFDMEEEIVSGIFWFDLENPWTGETIEIREGRFDTHFSQ
ncbi:hypothetical protein [Avrilella dinanensis]|uniref:hypothetical protein n=1 Tax=Avrilella dinanensis TaxID=2008672 RepID=UPI002409D8F9|nr:hypothetical protein [Avrilella dinanensis]